MKVYFTFIFAIILINTLISNNQTIEELDKEKQKIKIALKEKNEKINKLNEELEEITQVIIRTTKTLNQKIEDVIKKQEELLKIQDDIVSTEKILTSLQNSISNINFNINKKEIEIKNQENKIKEKEEILNEIKEELDSRTKKAYDFGIKNNISKENKKYLINYYDSIKKEDLKLRRYYRKQKNKLEDDKKTLEESKKSLQNEITIMEKKRKKNDIIIENLKERKKLKESSLADLKNEKTNLKERLNKENNQKKNTKEQIEITKSLISNLLKDEIKNKKIKEELVEKRQQQKQIISKNFKEMRGKLQWPVSGKIITRWGEKTNEEFNTKTEELGIEIECARHTSAKTIMDGIISNINFLPGTGNIIMINHGDDYTTIYSNIDGTIIENNDGSKTIYSNINNSISVSENQYISSNFKIGTVGDNPLNNNGKLYFQIWYKDTHLNPEKWLIKK